jgi:hypothetical protein
MEPIVIDGKKYNQNNIDEYINLLGQKNWNMVSISFGSNDIWGTVAAIFIFQRAYDSRVLRLRFKRVKS